MWLLTEYVSSWCHLEMKKYTDWELGWSEGERLKSLIPMNQGTQYLFLFLLTVNTNPNQINKSLTVVKDSVFQVHCRVVIN